MSEPITLTARGGVGIITIDNPPVNAIGLGVPEGIARSLDTVGVAEVCGRAREFHKRHGALWAAAPLLARLAGEGKKFAHWDRERAAQ